MLRSGMVRENAKVLWCGSTATHWCIQLPAKIYHMHRQSITRSSHRRKTGIIRAAIWLVTKARQYVILRPAPAYNSTTV